jgi:hypothetical protein
MEQIWIRNICLLEEDSGDHLINFNTIHSYCKKKKSFMLSFHLFVFFAWKWAIFGTIEEITCIYLILSKKINLYIFNWVQNALHHFVFKEFKEIINGNWILTISKEIDESMVFLFTW